MNQYLARRDYQLHRIDAALEEIGQWPEKKRAAMRAMIHALECERAEVLRSHARASGGPSRRLAGLAERVAA